MYATQCRVVAFPAVVAGEHRSVSRAPARTLASIFASTTEDNEEIFDPIKPASLSPSMQENGERERESQRVLSSVLTLRTLAYCRHRCSRGRRSNGVDTFFISSSLSYSLSLAPLWLILQQGFSGIQRNFPSRVGATARAQFVPMEF